VVEVREWGRVLKNGWERKNVGWWGEGGIGITGIVHVLRVSLTFESLAGRP
jgi:hypothetical protein